MKKFGLLILLALLISIGGVYATWVYSQSDDVADITAARAITMTEATFEGNYGTYSYDVSALSLKVDPKEGTSHVTSLKIEGYIVIKFTPSTYAPEEVKQHAVATTYTFGVSNDNWLYNGKTIIAVDSTAKNVNWVLGADGVFTYTVTAEELASILTLTEFTLDTKTDYDLFDKALLGGQITLAISDGKTTTSTN